MQPKPVPYLPTLQVCRWWASIAQALKAVQRSAACCC